MKTNDPRQMYLQQTVQALQNVLARGLVGEPLQAQAEVVVGPRAGAVLLYTGLGAGGVLRYFAADHAAAARQFIGWSFTGEPGVFMSGRAVRIEAPWPDALADTEVRLDRVGGSPKGQGRWKAGIDERGRVITAGVSDHIPHWLISGTTGSGKTVALRAAGYQFSQDADQNRIVLIDGKFGSGLGVLHGLPGMVGPVATDVPTARDALAWVNRQMQQRYEKLTSAGEQVLSGLPRIVVLFDEFQELVSDPAVRELTRRLLAQGRAANIHVLMGTQHPTIDAFGDDGSLKRNLVGRIALKVTDAKASQVALGDSLPRADRLAGKGDAYVVAPGHVYRAQMVLVDHRELDPAPRCDPLLREWPESQPQDYGQEPTVRWSYTGAELAQGLIAALRGWGRRNLMQSLANAGLGRPGADRASRLLVLGREQFAALAAAGYGLSEA